VWDIQVFLGFTNFYQQFIVHYFKVVVLLSDLTKGVKKGQAVPKFHMTQEAKNAFTELKKHFTTASVLVHFDLTKKIWIEPNVSGFAVAAILTQLQENGQWHSVAYWSCKMQDAEHRYEIHDKKLLAIVAAFKQWCHYLKNSKYSIVVLSDHANLCYFMTTKKLNECQAC
jgi:hypothetical protein